VGRCKKHSPLLAFADELAYLTLPAESLYGRVELAAIPEIRDASGGS